jgi:hypothetical protein
MVVLPLLLVFGDRLFPAFIGLPRVSPRFCRARPLRAI